MMKFYFPFILAFIVYSCDTSGVSKNTVEKKPVVSSKPDNYSLDADHKTIETKNFDNGLMIEWFEKGDGEKVKKGDLIEIDYKVRLKDGNIVDGNHLLKKESLPFMVGYNMQTKGWDIALSDMNVGDFARIKIPSHLARGEKGVNGLIPPNSDNFLTIRILSKIKPDRVVDGTKVWVLEENKNNEEKFGEGYKVQFHAMASSPSTPLFANTFRSNQPFEFRLGDQGIVPGLRKALINAKTSDRMYVLVPASEAYGDKGYMDFVKPGEDIFYNLLVMEVVK
jgi:FKBP-type peptidyl-prolyl cis-trans isomerase